MGIDMSLGDHLKANVAYLDEASQRAALEKKAQTNEDTLKQLLMAKFFFDYAFRVFEHRLLNGKLPGAVALGGKTFREAADLLNSHRRNIPPQKSRLWRTEGKGIWSKNHPLYSVWEEFEARCSASGLVPQWVYAHDGVGCESWFELSVSAAE